MLRPTAELMPQESTIAPEPTRQAIEHATGARPRVALGRAAIAAALAGLALFTGLIAYQGLGAVAAALAVAGWGLAAVSAFHLLPMVLDTLGWRALLPRGAIPLPALVRYRWIGESVNGLLPVAQVGGDLVKARLATQRGLPGALAGASVVVDLTLAVLTQVAFTLAGLALLVLVLGDGELARAVLIGVGLGALLLAGFYAVQRRGLFLGLARALERVASGRRWLALTGGARALDAAIQRAYADRRAILRACGWRLLGWLAGTGEVWLALWFLGHPVGLVEALLLESLGQAVRAAAFAVPGALGVQEGGYLVLGSALGLAPEVALALSLSKRVRELALGLPGLVAWQAIEGRRLWRARRGRRPRAAR